MFFSYSVALVSVALASIVNVPTAFGLAHDGEPVASDLTPSTIKISFKSWYENEITSETTTKVQDSLISTSNRSYYSNKHLGAMKMFETTMIGSNQSPIANANTEQYQLRYQYSFEIETNCVCDVCTNHGLLVHGAGIIEEANSCNCNRCTEHPGDDEDGLSVLVHGKTESENKKSDYLLQWENHLCGALSIDLGYSVDDCKIDITTPIATEDAYEYMEEEDKKN